MHFAGGNSYSYNFLKESLSNSFEFIPLELPGRGKRFQEELLTTKDEAVNDYVHQIQMHRNNQPFIIFGHSMGATLGLSVTKKLEEINDSPECLIVSGNSGPQKRDEEATVRYTLNDKDFKEELRDLGGVPEEILTNEELYEFFSPIIRSDFEILEKDVFSEKGVIIKTPIVAIMGYEEDTSDEIENWRKFTSGTFTFQRMTGNHFFIYNHVDTISTIVKQIH